MPNSIQNLVGCYKNPQMFVPQTLKIHQSGQILPNQVTLALSEFGFILRAVNETFVIEAFASSCLF